MTECCFGKHLAIVSPPRSSGHRIHVPFSRTSGLYVLRAIAYGASSVNDVPTAPPIHRCMAIHSSRTSHHIGVMSSQDATHFMHRRLHIGSTHLRSLPTITADAPSLLSRGSHDACDACTEAHDTRHPHNTPRYKPSYAGRLIHADIAGPFLPSQRGNFQYALILVDDHTRFKSVHLLRHKSEAPAAVKKFIASFTASLNRNSATNSKLIGSIHSDNAGEFLSAEFAAYLQVKTAT
eukprot:6197080-Pleurochrysis_carterae.AAC.1